MEEEEELQQSKKYDRKKLSNEMNEMRQALEAMQNEMTQLRTQNEELVAAHTQEGDPELKQTLVELQQQMTVLKAQNEKLAQDTQMRSEELFNINPNRAMI